MNLDTIIEKHIPNINRWINSLNNFTNINNLQTERSQNEVIDTLYEILCVFREYANVKDTWKPAMVSGHAYGYEIHIESIKTGSKYSFGFDYEGVYLETFLMNWKNLGLMKDEFWNAFMRLNTYGTIKPIDCYATKETKKLYPQLFRNNTSIVYSLMRQYFLTQFEIETNVSPTLLIKWDTENYYLNDVLKFGCQSFKDLYTMNYMLWKAK